jgi:hypothetical protein
MVLGATYSDGFVRIISLAVTIYQLERDLGVWISSNLKWNKQVNEQCARANKELSYIRRNTRTIHSILTRKKLYIFDHGHGTITFKGHKSGHLDLANLC